MALTAAMSVTPVHGLVPFQTPRSDTLHVLVYNIHAGKDAQGVDNLERVARVVRDHGVEVALFQEVDRGTERSGGADQPGRLGWLTALYDTFGRTLAFQGGEYGVATFSFRPAATRSVTSLTAVPSAERAEGSREPRGALHVAIPLRSAELHFVNTHLDPGTESDTRMQEARVLLDLASRLRAGGSPVLIGGDLNAEPSSDVVALLLDAGWTDLWARCGSGAGDTYPASEPSKRIDYLFATAEVVCVSARVLESEASDHRPLLVTVVIPDK